MEYYEKVKLFLIQWYGPDNPQQKWFIVATIFLFMCMPRNSRRLGAILFFTTIGSWFVSHWVFMAYEEYTPH